GVAVDASGVYVGGSTWTNNFSNIRSYLRKYDADGNELWTRHYGDNNNQIYGLAADGSGVYMALLYDVSLVKKTDSNANEIWNLQARPARGYGADAFSITASASGVVVAGGTSGGTLPGQTNAGGSDAFVAKIDQPPDVSAISVPQGSLEIETPLAVRASLTHPHVTNTHPAIWGWGDGETSFGTVSENQGSSSVSASHTYYSPGAYIVTLTVTDGAGASAQSVSEQFMVQAPSQPRGESPISAALVKDIDTLGAGVP